MTKAICCFCGEMKIGSLTTCNHCGQRPQHRDDIVMSMAFTDHFIDAQQLLEIAEAVKQRRPVQLPPDFVAELEKTLGYR